MLTNSELSRFWTLVIWALAFVGAFTLLVILLFLALGFLNQ